jgi:hypothetical protein
MTSPSQKLCVTSLVLHATDNAVSWITLNRPEAMNALLPSSENASSNYWRPRPPTRASG